ncbi:MAG: hypothetical protein J6X19_07510 [Clostridia bacterium]|nr:hypothetical protein [Clostridia bacterium]
MAMKLGELFRDNMVLAAGLPVRVFGSGKGTVIIEFRGETREWKVGNADDGNTGNFDGFDSGLDSGEWVVELPAGEAGGPFEMRITLIASQSAGGQTFVETFVPAEGQTFVLRDVYVGKVYLLAGQSNAEFNLAESTTPPEQWVGDPMLRNYFVDRPWIPEDVFAPGSGWMPARTHEIGRWSALAYLVGQSMRRRTNEPVGIISCFQGASVIEAWLPPADAERFRLPDGEVYIDHWYPDFAAWNGNATIYERMLTRVARYPVSGVIWYQGESDTSVAEASIYDAELACFAHEVRHLQQNPGLRFAVVQIADYDHRADNDPAGWQGIQDAQARAASADNGFVLVPSRDVCESSCIHPPTKSLLAERIADALF